MSSTTIYVSKTTGSDTLGDGSIQKPYLSLNKAISVSLSNDTIIVGPGVYNEQVIVNKPLTINGEQQNVSAINTDGTIRNATESVIQGNNNGSGICFTITSNNVVINGFKCILPVSEKVRDAFNLKNTPAGLENIATLENIIIKNNIIQNLRASGQSQAILFGESTNNNFLNTNGNGIWNNIEIANNYFDSSSAGNGYRGIQFSSQFKSVSYNNINIHNNHFIHSVNITSNRAIGVTSNISVVDRGPTYLNSFKINNNYFNTPGNTSIGGLFDCDGNSEINGNTFNNCKYGISSINFKEAGGKIQNNIFTVTEYSIGISDNIYATTNGSNIIIIGNSFNGNPTKHIECSSQDVNFTNLMNDNTFNGYVLKSAESTYNQYGNTSNPLLNRVTRSIYPTISKGITAIGIESIYVGPGTYISNIIINKSVTLLGENKDTTIIQPSDTANATVQITDGASGTTIKNFTIKGKFDAQTTTGIGNTDNNNSAILVLNTDTSLNPEIKNLLLDNLILKQASNGIAFNNKNSQNITIRGCVIEQNEGSGIRIATNIETMNGFLIDNCTIQNNNSNAITVNPSGTYRPNCTNYTINNCRIIHNNKLTLNNSHDVSIFGFNGNLTISNTDIECNHAASKAINGTPDTSGGWGLIINGSGNSNTYYPSGNISISNLKIMGTVTKSCFGFDRYSTLNDISLNDLDIKDCQANIAGQTWLQLSVGHRDTSKSFMLGNTKLKTIYTTNIGNVDATNSYFYDNTTGIDLTDLQQINNQIYDKIDNPLIGKVLVVIGVTFSNPAIPNSIGDNLNNPEVTTIYLSAGTYTQRGSLINTTSNPITIIAFSKHIILRCFRL